MNSSVLTVSQLNKYIKSLIDGDLNLTSFFIEGEISNFKNHYASGHLYFSLKDDNSVVKCIMFSRSAARLKFVPQDGMKVICRGKASVYERDGQYQLYLEEMQPIGIGALAVRFEQLKSKLENEGLFSPETKRPIPKSVNRIAVITSSQGAAIKDIISIAQRRNPAVEIVVCPVVVQGEYAAESMVNMLEKVYSLNGIDVIIIGRGGGSYEDLFCFNDEELVRKIYEAPVPVISAVGHERDFTLCDFVADVRAATPSAAAEIAVVDLRKEAEMLSFLKSRLIQSARFCIDSASERFDRCISSMSFSSPTRYVDLKEKDFYRIFSRFKTVCRAAFQENEAKFLVLLKGLESNNPASVMMRGYSIVESKCGLIKSADQIEVGERIRIKFSSGSADCAVIEINKEN